MQILSDAYKLRYYDNLNGSLSFGFLSNQLLAELDFTIDLIDSRLSLKSELMGEVVLTPYQIAVNNNDEKVYFNNYVLNKIDKKEFMERKSKSYTLHIEKNGFEFEITGDGLKVQEYDGKMQRVLNVELVNKNK